MVFKTNASNLDELDIARAELAAFSVEEEAPIYIGQGEFSGAPTWLQQVIDRAAMFDYGNFSPTRWQRIQLERYDRTFDHSTHNLYPFVGKIEPRLARACINLAVGHKDFATVVDPFCGSGTILLEANLMGFNVVGGDLDPFAYWLSMMKLSLDDDEYDQVVRKLNPGFARHNTVLAQQRRACPPRKSAKGWLYCKPAEITLSQSLGGKVEAIVTSPPYYDAINYNDRHAEIRRRLDLGAPRQQSMGIDQSVYDYGADIVKVSQAMFNSLAIRGRIVLIAASYHGVDVPQLYLNALEKLGMRPIQRLKRAYRSPVLDVKEDVILVMEKP